MSKEDTIAELRKVIEVLESPHVAEVVVNYRGQTNDVRYYDVQTHNGRHRYTVRVQDLFNEMTNEMDRWTKCSCAAGANDIVCRHVLKVAEVDSRQTGRSLFFATFQNYKAHQSARKSQQSI